MKTKMNLIRLRYTVSRSEKRLPLAEQFSEYLVVGKRRRRGSP